MAAIIKIYPEKGNPFPIFVNSDENNESAQQLLDQFQTDLKKTIFNLPKGTASYQISYDQKDRFSNNLRPTNNPIYLDNLQSSMIIIKTRSLVFQGSTIEKIFIGHKTPEDLDAFRSIWEKYHLC